MSQNRFKSNVLNRFLSITDTQQDTDSRNTNNSVGDNSSSIRARPTFLNSTNSAITAALSLIKSQVNSSNQRLEAMEPSVNPQRPTLVDHPPDEIPAAYFRVDKKLFEKLNKLSEKILKYCQSERMQLINSPPYIIDILPDICQVLNVIHATYESKFHVLENIEYFCVMSRNLLEKLQGIIELFKMAGKRIYDERSEERAKLTKFTLLLSHMLAEMKSLFPKDVYEGQSFRVAKQDAAEFWRCNFREKTVVAWPEFERKLNRVHKIANPTEAVKLRETVQLSESRYVSIFEFDIFTRLFQPWNNLLNNWKFLATEHPAYSAFSTYDEVHKRLQKYTHKPGSYLFRLSCTKLGQWAIGYVTHDHKILQTIPQSLVQALIDGHKQNLYLYPNGEDTPIDISSAIAVTSASRIQCSREQYDMYCDMGTSFQLCKICSENNKDRKLEPCGHLICSSCLENWQEHNNTPSCPFCRCEIKTFEPIIISPFQKTSTVARLTPQPQEQCSYLNDNLLDGDEYVQPQQKNSMAMSTLSATSSSSNSLQDSKKFNHRNDTSSLNTDDGQNSDESLTKAITESLSNAFNQVNFNTSDQINASSRASSSNIQPPIFPPPLPPPPNLNPPTKPVPPLPPSASTSVIVKAQESKSSHFISIKIENASVLEHLVSNYGFDRTKIACALLIAGNDMKAALEILQRYKHLR